MPFVLTNTSTVFQTLLRCLLENRLFAKADKCEFRASSVSFLGFIVGQGQQEEEQEGTKNTTPDAFSHQFATDQLNQDPILLPSCIVGDC